MIKNIGVSVRNRLLNIAKDEKQEYMKILVRYLHERLLYRISVSQYKQQFLLKGSALLYAYDRFKTLPTIDIDLMGNRIDRDRLFLKSVFQEICAIKCPEDGVSFDSDSISLEPIAVEKKYPGSCVTVSAHLDTIVQKVSLDIGFGDVVTPEPVHLDYLILLDNMPSVDLYAYSLETLVAEKFHAMVDRDESNSRMKDFFDVFFVLRNHTIDNDVLKEAITATFKNRNTKYRDDLNLFTKNFAKDKDRNLQWVHFLKRIKWKENLSFIEVMDFIKQNLYGYWSKDLLG